MKRLKEWNICTCWYHIKLNEFQFGLNVMWVLEEGIHNDRVCPCQNVCKPELYNMSSHEPPCNTHFQTYNTLTSMWSSILCSKEVTIEFHRRSCIMGHCHNCGNELLKVCPKKLCSSKKTQWWSIGHEVVGKTSEGWNKKVTRVLYNDITPLSWQSISSLVFQNLWYTTSYPVGKRKSLNTIWNTYLRTL